MESLTGTISTHYGLMVTDAMFMIGVNCDIDPIAAVYTLLTKIPHEMYEELRVHVIPLVRARLLTYIRENQRKTPGPEALRPVSIRDTNIKFRKALGRMVRACGLCITVLDELHDQPM
jgi:hypothetical protein